MSTLAVVSVVLMAVLYWMRTRLPDEITIAGGPANGRYAMLAHGIAEELERRFSIRVNILQTKGSLENLRLLEAHEADLALYQPGTRLILEGDEPTESASEPARFVSNLYPEFLIPVGPVSRESIGFDQIEDRIWCCNDRLSGDYAVTRLLLQHLGLDESEIDVLSVSYGDLPGEMRTGEISIGILCCGLQAPILQTVLQPDTGQLLPIPAVEALARKHTSLKRETIPAGFFSTSPMIPSQEFETVALQAQLLADAEAPVRLIEEVTRILSDTRFQRRHGLAELFSGGRDYATDRPEYAMHAGAAHVYHPGLKPLLNPDFVEGTEGLRSFIVSLIAAAWLLHRWWRRRQILGQEHRLDRFIRELLELEKAQMDVDGEGKADEASMLQTMLDRVTILRQEALSEFTAHELSEDRAVDCFIEMCHALSDKINAKLTRQCLLQSLTQRQ